MHILELHNGATLSQGVSIEFPSFVNFYHAKRVKTNFFLCVYIIRKASSVAAKVTQKIALDCGILGICFQILLLEFLALSLTMPLFFI